MNAYPPRLRRLSLLVIISSNAAAAMAFGLLQPLLAIRMEAAGASSTMIGVVVSVWSLAILVGGPFYPAIIQRLGIMPSLFVGLVVTAVLIVLFPLVESFAAWSLFQFLLGLTFGHFWVLSEAWINAMARDETRARTTSAYVVSLGLGASFGPLLVKFVGVDGFFPFFLCSAFLLLGTAPLFLLRGISPPLEDDEPPALLSSIRVFPALLAIGLIAGFADQGPPGLLPVYVLESGFDAGLAATILFVMGLGKAVFVIPIGMIADRFRVEPTLIVCALLCALLSLALSSVMGRAELLYPLVFLWGATFDAFYALGLASIGARFQRGQLAAANAVFIMLHSTGSFGGSVVLGQVMDVAGPIGFPVGTALLIALLPAALWISGLIGRNRKA